MARSTLALAGLVAVLGAACSGPGRSDAADAVRSFEHAVRTGDGEAACRVLAPPVVESLEADGDPCSEAILAGELGTALAERADDAPARRTATAGVQAQVRTRSDVLFLTASGDRWLITAAVCDPRPDRPYDCRLEGS